MKIFAAGLATETNTFCPELTDLSDFSVQRGKDVLAGRVMFPSLDLSATWGRQASAGGHEFIFALNAFAQPSGITIRAAYERLRDEILGELRAVMPVDVVLLTLHGAMVAQGYDDCEEDIIRCIREIVGPSAVIGAEFDLHCHFSASKIACADIVITYKEYPHVDVYERAQELFVLAMAAGEGKIRPTKALFDCRMMGLYPTSRQPLRRFVDSMITAEQRKDVLSVSLGHGFPFGDVPHGGAKLLVITDGDESSARSISQELGRRFYALRSEIAFHSFSLPMEEALREALESRDTPVVVADQSDNTGAGAPGDSTFALNWLLEHRVKDVGLAILYDPGVVKAAKEAGKDARLSVSLGGKMSAASGSPVDLEVLVLGVIENYMHGLPQRSGDPWLFPAGDVVALRSRVGDIVVSSQRCQCFSPSVFWDLGIDPQRKHILIVKSYQHFYDAFTPIAKRIIYMTASGAVPPDPRQVSYRRFDTSNHYPWVDDPLDRTTK
jgi:microcystin degradation protein MlrC